MLVAVQRHFVLEYASGLTSKCSYHKEGTIIAIGPSLHYQLQQDKPEASEGHARGGVLFLETYLLQCNVGNSLSGILINLI